MRTRQGLCRPPASSPDGVPRCRCRRRRWCPHHRWSWPPAPAVALRRHALQLHHPTVGDGGIGPRPGLGDRGVVEAAHQANRWQLGEPPRDQALRDRGGERRGRGRPWRGRCAPLGRHRRPGVVVVGNRVVDHIQHLPRPWTRLRLGDELAQQRDVDVDGSRGHRIGAGAAGVVIGCGGGWCGRAPRTQQGQDHHSSDHGPPGEGRRPSRQSTSVGHQLPPRHAAVLSTTTIAQPRQDLRRTGQPAGSRHPRYPFAQL